MRITLVYTLSSPGVALKRWEIGVQRERERERGRRREVEKEEDLERRKKYKNNERENGEKKKRKKYEVHGGWERRRSRRRQPVGPSTLGRDDEGHMLISQEEHNYSTWQRRRVNNDGVAVFPPSTDCHARMCYERSAPSITRCQLPP